MKNISRPVMIGLLGAMAGGAPAWAANPSNGLRIEVITAYNLVVDSNVGTPASYSPSAAYLGATVYNDGSSDLTNVVVHFGDYAAGTPGVYPARTCPEYAGDPLSGTFSLTHEGGTSGLADATRYLGTLAAGESRTVYWLISYPLMDADGTSMFRDDVDPTNDFWLEYDVWVTATRDSTPVTADETKTLTFRNEISASANKILPNTANKVPQEYQDLLSMYMPMWTNGNYDGSPGTHVVTEGIWYDLGNVGAGFDNNGDFVPDRNAWLQPVGDASKFDASAFRLANTRVLIVVSLNDGTEVVYTDEDQLYFEHIPENNVSVVGYVAYTFEVLKSEGYSQLSPYQEVASGYDNEKFNGDYGTSMGWVLTSTPARVTMEKTVDRATAYPGSNLWYSVSYTNTGTVSVGHPEQGLPLVVQDEIPIGTAYVAGSATLSNTPPAGVAGYTVLYSTNAGASWLSSEPATATEVTHLQWWLSDAMATGTWGEVRFRVQVDDPYAYPNPMIVNTAGLSFGNTTPFLTDTAETLVLGNNGLGDTVFVDDGSGDGYLGNQIQDGSEPGISGVTVRVYLDINTNSVYDAADVLLATTNTSASGSYGVTNLPDGYYIVTVDKSDPALPFGSTPTTPTYYAIPLDPTHASGTGVSDLTADFGFVPTLAVTKSLPTTADLREGDVITYSITVTNRLPGDGTGGGSARTYTRWAQAGTPVGSGQKDWINSTNAYDVGEPDGLYAETPMAAASETLSLSNFFIGTQIGNVTNVKVVMRLRRTSGTFDRQDALTVTVSMTGGSPTTRSYYPTNFSTTWQDVEIDVTTNKTWTWSDFGTASPAVTLVSDGKPSDPGAVQLEGVYFLVTSDEATGAATDVNTLNPVPLWDGFDTNRLQFVSASPLVDSVTYTGAAPNVGRLYWDNIGPIYAGGAATVYATFKVLEPPGNAQNNVTNTAWVTEATYIDGRPASQGTSEVVRLVLPAGTIGDFLWRDLDNGGDYDDGEPGIANVSVRLQYPSGLSFTNTTDASGYYLFEGIPESGSFTVTVLTATLPGGSGSNTYDEDGNHDSQTTFALTYDSTTGEDTHLSADFGYYLSSTIEGTIWNDLNRSGTSAPDDGEDWMYNVTVQLYSNGVQLAQTATDANGFFQFTGDFSSTFAYDVTVVSNTGPMATGSWTPSYDTNGTNTPSTVSVTVPSGGVARADFSYFETGDYDIGDTVYFDWDGDGAQDAGEEGMAGITVWLYEDNNGNGTIDAGTDALIATDVTDTDGVYTFYDHPAGYYIVVVNEADPDFPDLYTCTADPTGAKDGVSAFELTGTLMDRDFGYRPYGTGTIGDTVWRDRNGNGLQDTVFEYGISNVTVTLAVDMNGDGTYVTLSNLVTDVNGTYLFTSLPDGDYRVTVDVDDPDIPIAALGCPAQPSTPTSYDIAVSGGGSYLYADFGFVRLGSIGDTVFWDANGNGTQDYGEGGISNVTVSLYYHDGASRTNETADVFLTNVVTDASGQYHFDLLYPSNYIVVVSNVGVLATATCTSDPDADGDPNGPLRDGQYVYNLAWSENFTGADFGYQPPSRLGDTLWIDSNTNGVQDYGESGLAGVPVILYSNGTVIASTATDADGKYYFYNFPDGTYAVNVDTANSNFPSGLVQVYDPDGAFDSIATNIVVSGGLVTSIGGTAVTNANLAIDFGYVYSGSTVLSGTVGLDDPTFDGLLNGTVTTGVSSAEIPFAGVNVYLNLWTDDGDGVIEAGETRPLASTMTATNGDYLFTNVPSNAPVGIATNYYIVSLAAPMENLLLTTATTNGAAQALSVVNSTNAQGYTVGAYQVLAMAPAWANVDFAFKSGVNYDFGDLPSSFGTRVEDAFSAARHIVPATPTLYLGATADTEQNGLPTTDATGDNTDSTDDEDGVVPFGIWSAGGTGAVEVTVGGGSGWLVGYVDFNNDGVFTNAGELVIDQAVSSTGGNGSGVYTNQFAIPEGAINPTNATALYTRFRLFPSKPAFAALAYFGEASDGEVEDYRWQFGIISDLVWYDGNGNGANDTGEVGVPGVRVYIDQNANGLYDSGEPSAVTDTSGIYHLSGFLPDTFTVAVDTNTLTTGYYQTYDLDGLDSTNEADVVLASGQVVVNADFGYDSDPTLVVLSGVRAFMRNGEAIVQWTTEMEIGAVEFHVDRLEGEGWVRVNAEPIPAQLFASGPVVYETADPSAAAGGTYAYRIVEIDNRNRTLTYGPYTLTVDGRAVSYDAWMQQAFADPAVGGRDMDPDGDGLTNFQEYLAGTDPLDANSLLAITSIEVVQNAGSVVIKWTSSPDTTYGVAISTDVKSGFLPFIHGIPATPPVNTLEIPVSSERSVFFRVIVE